jgi:hypothetical protein
MDLRMTERQPGWTAPGETPRNAEPHEPGPAADPAPTMRAAEHRAPTYDGVERRAQPRCIDCSPQAERAGSWGGRHR